MWFQEYKNRSICPTTGKTMYETEEEAWDSLEYFSKKTPNYDDGFPYYCLYCEKYHFGRKNNRKTKKKRKRT